VSVSLSERVLSIYKLTPKQHTVALERGRDIVVTAGAGSGKTRTLVARYACLLADGLSPRRVVAVTFTEKAAREMRSRVREGLGELVQKAEDDLERQAWLNLNSQIDSARIGTIHSLCAEILRAHPAEAGVDPRFDVLDEGLSAALRVQVLNDTLNTLVGLPEYTLLFKILGTSSLQELLDTLLKRRLEAQESFQQNVDGEKTIIQFITNRLNSPLLADPIAELRGMTASVLTNDAGDKLTNMVKVLLQLWSEAESALEDGDGIACAEKLFQARRENMLGTIGSKSSKAKESVKALKNAYDEMLNPIIGGANSKDVPPSRESETSFAQLQPLVRSAFEILHQGYIASLDQRHALDFDDLEYGAAQLLKRDDIRTRWQDELDALLVDEFQDTNARQREIVEALAGKAGHLFVVGDARQSIYRFRRADVTVFRAIQQKVESEGGLVMDLDVTYRAHEPLLDTMSDMLSTVMGNTEDPTRPYYVPFSPLTASRKDVPEHISGTHVELIIGTGEDTATARPIAAQALASRLLELKKTKQIKNWDDVALLFRASTGFAYYEDAFEEMGIPFVTVAGRGFYDRPEIRDILNILRALADPADDLAMAGLLRSPAFGLTDAALYQLRWKGTQTISYWTALQGDLSLLEVSDQSRARLVSGILNQLLPLVDRTPVAELLKRVVDLTDYRAVLASDDSSGSNGRLWRNLDKLQTDAQTSGQVNVRDFLDYLATLNDAGAREGEATAEAQGAVRLMTIHKSKGLEFPVVVLADAGREPRSVSESAYLLPELGFSFKLDDPSMLYRLSKWQDKQQGDAESLRLLYVALTRAKNKLLISGHAARGGTAAWMSDLCTAAGVDIASLLEEEKQPFETRTTSGHAVNVWWSVEKRESALAILSEQEAPLESSDRDLFSSLIEPAPQLVEEDEVNVLHTWRATGSGKHVPAGVIGLMVHKAIELWCFLDETRLIPLLESAALNAGLASEEQRVEAVRRARELLERLKLDPFWETLNSAEERHHEVPYSRISNDWAESGYIDLLCRIGSDWYIVDFKTDTIRSDQEREELIGQYSRQLQRYQSAVKSLIGQAAQAQLCFLDDNGRVRVNEVSASK
jgi:ATP-dependent helicase/nuclease subunit A